MPTEKDEEEKELQFLVRISRIGSENFFVVTATDAWKAMEKVVDNFRINNPISWSLKSISISELIGDGDIKFQKSRFE